MSLAMAETKYRKSDAKLDRSATSDSEIRVVDPKTGGAKGQKIERYDLIPAEPLRQLALVYGAGAKKYDDDNWRKGYAWRLSLGAAMRHVWTWVCGEKYDPEVSELAGQPVSHLACAAWHCFALMEFQAFGLGTNDIAEQVRQTNASHPIDLREEAGRG